MSHTTIELPNDMKSHRMKKDVDSISFKITARCKFCFSDPTPCFPDFLAADTYDARSKPYGPYTPNQAGTVLYSTSIPPADCTLRENKDTVCSITVDS
jgi:hypothetical protein